MKILKCWKINILLKEIIEKLEKTDWDLYTPTPDTDPFATINHPLWVDGEWVAVDVVLTAVLCWRNPNIKTTIRQDQIGWDKTAGHRSSGCAGVHARHT